MFKDYFKSIFSKREDETLRDKKLDISIHVMILKNLLYQEGDPVMRNHIRKKLNKYTNEWNNLCT